MSTTKWKAIARFPVTKVIRKRVVEDAKRKASLCADIVSEQLSGKLMHTFLL